MNDIANRTIFPKGNKFPENYSKHFVGQAWVHILVDKNDEWDCTIGNVTFEPGCRNSWHKHPSGQILLITSGRGWFQEWGKEVQTLGPGDVVKIPANIKHWHGAAKNSWFTHIYIQKEPTEWMEPVSIDEYNKLK